MKILYGLCGEGMGHATRSKVSIEYLHKLGHEILIASPGKAHAMLSKSFSNTPGITMLEIIGLSMHCSDGTLDLRKTVEKNAQRAPEMMLRNAEAWWMTEMFAPEAAIADYDSFSWLFARAHGLPVVSIDNAQILPRCVHPNEVLSIHAGGFKAFESFTTVITPECEHYIITSFFFPPTKPGFERNTTLVPPVLRTEVIRALDNLPQQKEHLLVYKTNSLDDMTLLRALHGVPAKFLVYGVSPDTPLPPNCSYRPFDEKAFIQDLAASRGVLSNGGMSATGEALAFGKPIYAIPVREQFEQVLNARYIEHIGYGRTSEYVDPRVLMHFLESLPRFSANIRAIPQQDGNQRLYTTLEGLFGRITPNLAP